MLTKFHGRINPERKDLFPSHVVGFQPLHGAGFPLQSLTQKTLSYQNVEMLKIYLFMRKIGYFRRKKDLMFKHLLLQFSLTIVVSSVLSQITITSQDLFNIGDHIYLYEDIAAKSKYVSPGNSGANQTWDFSGFQLNSLEDSLTIVDPTTTPYYSLFPNANLANYGNYFVGNVYDYFSLQTNYLIHQGSAFSSDTSFSSDTLYQLPLVYNTNYLPSKDYIRRSLYIPNNTLNYDSAVSISRIISSNIVDGWGNVILPFATYNSLRLKSFQLDSFANYYYKNGNLINSDSGNATNVYYQWWTKDVPYAVFEADIIDSTGLINHAFFYLETKQITSEDEQVKSFYKMYPNPAKNQINFTNLSNEVYAIKIIDLTGKLIKTELNPTSNLVRLDISSFNNGLYIYDIIDQKGTSLEKGKFSVLK